MKTRKHFLAFLLFSLFTASAVNAQTFNFDGVTPPAKPAGLVYTGSGWATSATQSKSAPNSLITTDASVQDLAMTSAQDTSSGNVIYSEDFFYTPGPNNSGIVQINGYLRASNNTSVGSMTGYGFQLTAGYNASGLAIVKYTNGGVGVLTGGGSYQYASDFAYNTWYHLAETANGSAISLSVSRYSDGDYIQPGGAWGAGQASVYTVTDTSVAAAAGYAGFADYNGNGTTLYTDNISLASTTGALTAPSLTPGAATPTTLALSWAAATGGVAPITYRVFRAPDVNGAPSTFAAVGSSTSSTSYTDPGLTPGTKYWYEVVATDSTTPTALTVTSAALFGTTTAMPVFAAFITVTPAATGDLVTIPTGAVVAGTNAVASVSLYEGPSAGGEAATPVATVSSPTYPLVFAAQAPAAAGAGNYYTVKVTDSAGYVSTASNEVAVKTSSLARTGTTRSAQTFVASYGPAFTGLSLGYVFYDSTGAVFARRATSGVSELTGQGIYSVQPLVDTGLTGGYILWDAPLGTSAFTEAVAAVTGTKRKVQ